MNIILHIIIFNYFYKFHKLFYIHYFFIVYKSLSIMYAKRFVAISYQILNRNLACLRRNSIELNSQKYKIDKIV